MGKKKSSKGGWNDEGFANNPFAAAIGKSASGQDAGSAKPAPKKNTAKKNTSENEPLQTTGRVEWASVKRAHVRAERKGRGGKTVTLISHIGLGGETLEKASKEVRKSLGCGGGVEKDEILLQGDQKERAVAWLEKAGVRRVTSAK